MHTSKFTWGEKKMRQWKRSEQGQKRYQAGFLFVFTVDMETETSRNAGM